MRQNEWFAHSAAPERAPEKLAEHLAHVANRAAAFAGAFGAQAEARVAGLLHDIGKYGDLYQRRLKGLEKGIDHWSVGAWLALEQYKADGIAVALAIQGHHIGLQRASGSDLKDLEPSRLAQTRPSPRLSEQDINILLERFSADGLRLPTKCDSLYRGLGPKGVRDPETSAMLDVRMLFSALVDADFIETEAHFGGSANIRHYRPEGAPLEVERAFSAVREYIEDLEVCSRSAPAIKKIRHDLLEACINEAESRQGVFTLSAPTGTGKTLAMLAFALRHAAKHGLRRVIVVIPYLSIIDQTVRTYRSVFKSFVDESELRRYVLEDHSLAGTRSARKTSSEYEDSSREDLIAENWDAPIVVTTSVQLLQSLFSNRPSACRKLHRLAASVIMFDEVQSLPLHLVLPTLGALSHLCERYRASVVFSTATQPAFDQLDEYVKNHARKGWCPHEIVPASLNLFGRSRRVRVQWSASGERAPWKEIVDDIVRKQAAKQVLCIVNVKRHALALFEELRARGLDGLAFLSTALCPRHRSEVLEKVRAELNHQRPCYLVATQCVEAGVDLDFPVVYRALGPLDAIAQAAGRCNRNGRQEEGSMVIFEPEDETLPDDAYRQATDVTRIMLRDGPIDLDDPESFRRYYTLLYSLRDFGGGNQGKTSPLDEAIKDQDFVKTAELYRVIARDGIDVLVPYQREIYEGLAAEARKDGIDRDWTFRARPYSVSLFRPRENDPVWSWLEPVRIKGGARSVFSDQWFVYLGVDHYDPETGLVPPRASDCLIA